MPTMRRINLVHGGTQYPIPTIAPPTNSDAKDVLFLKVLFTATNGVLSPNYQYSSISGTYRLPTTIQDFLYGACRNTYPQRISPITSSDGIPVVRWPSYVAFTIEGNVPAEFKGRVSSDINNSPCTTSDSTPNEYFNLGYYLDDDTVYDPSDPSDSPCHFVFFNAISPSANGKLNPSQTDGFNLNLDIGPIDPDIRNTGHTTGPGL
jgi:hypothetical protein